MFAVNGANFIRIFLPMISQVLTHPIISFSHSTTLLYRFRFWRSLKSKNDFLQKQNHTLRSPNELFYHYYYSLYYSSAIFNQIRGPIQKSRAPVSFRFFYGVTAREKNNIKSHVIGDLCLAVSLGA